MSDRYISRRRFLKAGTLASAGFALASTDALRSWAAHPRESIDAIVIGSGFGGAVAALRLAQAGVQTLLLERGRRWTITDAQNTFATLRAPDGRSSWLSKFAVVSDPGSTPIPIDVYTGVVELMVENGISVFAGAGVGGGSLVYNGSTYQPTRANFDRVFQGAVSYDEMDKVYYPRVRSILKPSTIPADILATNYYRFGRVALELAANAGLTGKLLEMNLDWDVIRQEIAGTRVASGIIGEFWYGNNSGCKNSLDRNYLLQAEESGFVEILPLHVVTDINEVPGNRYAVVCNQIDEGGNVLQTRTFISKHVFLAAGSVGTSKLLVKAKAKGTLPKLNDAVGQFWGADGDTFGLQGGLPPTNPSQGTPSVVIEDHANPIEPTVLLPGPQWNETREGYMYYLGMGIGSAKGSFNYDYSTDSVQLTWPKDSPEVVQVREAALHTFQTLNQANTSSAYQPTTVSVSDGVTGHQLGGAVLGKACDLYGRVKGYKGLYVVDGALIPGSTGATNPSFTIAALAERCVERLIAQDKIGK
ncbi:FAD-binding protein [Tolypothrix campylonemoides VB511288]|nr:FAD-binding protein [Tolypothrix campylonemoides VB511288]